MKVSIITVNYNQTAVTLDLLESVQNQDYKNCQMIVVDNGSQEDPSAQILEKYPWVEVVRSGKNLGFAGGNNLGIREAVGEFLFFINNDTVLPGNTIHRLVAHLQEHSETGMVSPMIYYYDQQDTLQYAGSTEVAAFTGRNESIGYKEKWQLEARVYDTAYPHGAAMMVPRSVIDQVGEMPENFFLYYEELDWSSKIKSLGYKVKVDRGSYILHKESVSTGKLSGLKTYFLTRNRILFMRRNVSWIKRFVFYSFFLLVALPKNLLVHLLKGERELLQAYFAGFWWNLGHSVNSQELGYKYNGLNR